MTAWLLDTNVGLFIAATALHHGLTVVSRDTRQYEQRARVPVLNPWES